MIFMAFCFRRCTMMRKFVLLCCFVVMSNSFAMFSFTKFLDAFGLKLMTSETNRCLASSFGSFSATEQALKLEVIQRQRFFERSDQVQLASRCKFIRAMLMVHGPEVPDDATLSYASELFLQAAEGGDTDAIEAVLASTMKSSITEALAVDRTVILASIRERIRFPVLIKEDFLQQSMVEAILDSIASIATNGKEGNIRAIIPDAKQEIADEGILTQRRSKFALLLGSAMPFFGDQDRLRIQRYIDRLDKAFLAFQEDTFGVSAFEKLEFLTNGGIPHTLVHPAVFNITGGIAELLATTPDKALSPLKDLILDDFRTVVGFIKTVGLIADDCKELNKTKALLFEFLEKWNEDSVAIYLTNDCDLPIVQQFMSDIRKVVEDLR